MSIGHQTDVWDWKKEPIPIGLGGSVFGWLVPPAECDAILDAYFQIGGRFIDTSDGYSHAQRVEAADSESLIGSWVKRRGVESQMRIVTKVGLCPGVSGLDPNVVARAASESIERLGVSVVEAILAHGDDGVTPAESVAEGFAQLLATTARHIGFSGFTAKRLIEIGAALTHLSAPLALVEEEFSLASGSGAERLLERITRSGQPGDTPAIGVLCSAALAQGFLTGKFRGASTRVGHRQRLVAQRYGSARHAALLEGVRQIADTHSVSPAAVAIRWLIQHKEVVLPLVSVTTASQLEAFEVAASLTISDGEWSFLRALSEDLEIPSATT